MRRLTFVGSLVLLFGLLCIPVHSKDVKEKSSVSGQKQTHGALVPVISRSIKNDVTIPLRDMKPIRKRPVENEAHEIKNRIMPKALASAGAGHRPDTVVQNAPLAKGKMPATFANFEGSPNDCGCLPPDTNGAVSGNFYVQTVNVEYQVWNHSGTSLLGPLDINTLWAGFGGDCESHNDGDPIVLYDKLADRWLISEFAVFGASNHQCIAISTTGDPTGAFFRYDFNVGTKLNDYPHFGVWPDAYYMSDNQFNGGFAGAGAYAFERDQMLLGNAAQKIYFDLGPVNNNFGGQLPSDLDGPVPPAGTPNVFAEIDDESVFGTDRISLWDFHVDWVTPGNSTFGVAGNPNLHLDTAPFDWDMCGFNRDCIPQPGTGQGLDAISDRLMYRLQYRDFGAYSTIVGNHTVDADGADRAGVRWFELRDSGSGWTINQQGTYAPGTENRWMGSAAMDSAGNIAIGYTASSGTVFPSVRYAGRLVSDALGTLPQPEGTIMAGTGNQTHPAARWGDYSGLTLDPTPGSAGGIGCDFWYTSEYIQTSGSANWQTRVGAFTFAPSACGGPTGTLNGHVRDTSANPISGATVTVQPGGFSTTTDGSGFYQFILGVGNYDVTASAYGYFSQTVNNVAVTNGGTTTQDFALVAAPVVTVNGTVKDGSGHGWGLYARIDITGYPNSPIFTDPDDGSYSVQLIQATNYTFNVSAISAGYVAQSRSVTPPGGGSTENFALLVDSSTCNAPGYGITGAIFEQFEGGGTTPPAGWTVVDNDGDGQVWRFDDPGGRGNLTGGTGGFATIDSDFEGGTQDSELISPTVNLSGVATVHIEFDSDFNWYDFSLDEKGDVDVSTDGGSTWTNVLQYAGADVRGPHHEDIDVSGIAGNQSNVKVRFHYYNADFEFWWQVDNVKVAAVCGPISGGLLIGNTYDLNAASGLNGVKVTSDNQPLDNTTSFATPLDTNVDDGFYILFSSLTGLQSFTATKSGYGPDTHSKTIVADGIASQNFSLGAGFLVADPNPLEATVDLGTQVVKTLTISNTGTADADFELQEGNGHTAGPTHAKGAPLTLIQGHFSPLRQGFTPKTKSKIKSHKEDQKIPFRKSKDAPWTGIADYPTSIMDNTCAEIDGLIYCVGGFDGGSNLSSGFVYNPGSDSWAPIADMTEIREKPAVAAIDGKLYVVGGWDSIGDPDPVLEIYDPGSDSWTFGADNTVPHGGGSTGVNLDGKFYVVGGCDGSCGVTDVQVYDPGSDSWSSAAGYPEAISWEACGAISSQIYCAGGTAGSSESQSTYVYDPGSDAWTQLADVPQTQWGMGYVASDDLLYISGGVTANFSTITNAGFSYDPGSDTWTPIANSNNTLYRGGSACGLYRIGGSIGGFSPVPDSEVYPGLTNCGGAVDVPWLSEDPTSATVPAGGSQPVDVTFDASAVSQPGDYLAHLKIKENTPYSVPDVQVTMHVPLPADWGTLEGTVTGLSRCDAPGGPLVGATVFVDTAGTDYTLQTDPAGHYSVSFPAADSPVTITVSDNGYVGQTASGVVIIAQQTTTRDFTLRLNAPCASKSPASFDVTLSAGGSVTLPLTMTNDGAGVFNYSISESALQLPPLKHSKNRKFSTAKPVGPLSARSMKARAGLKAMGVSAPSSWFLSFPLPGGLVRYAHAQCDTQLNSFYVISGVDGTFNTTKNAWRYDAAINSWTALAPIPTDQEGPAATCYQGKIYVLGGGGTDQFYIYDVGSDSWSTGANLPRPMWGAAVAGWNGQIFMIGGDSDFSGSGTSSEVNIYDIASDTWIGTGTSMPVAAATPGFSQAGANIYIVGGWDDFTTPSNNNSASQRYDLSTDTWTTGPNLNNPRGDLALSVTDTALYAMGGDGDGGGFFDSTDTVERLDYTSWPAGTWTDLGDPLPVAVTANNAGFCTEAIHAFGSVAEFWSVAGLDPNFVATGNNAFHATNEHCFTIFSDVPWVSEDPTSGSVAADSFGTVDVTFNATGLAAGDYTATLVIGTNDPGASQFNIPLTLHVTSGLFFDDFSDMDFTNPLWTVKPEGNWSAASGDLVVSDTKKKSDAIATAFVGCTDCTIVENVTLGTANSRISLFGWYQSKKTYVEVRLSDDKDDLRFYQKVDGTTVAKKSVDFPVAPGDHQIKVSYSGNTFNVYIDGSVTPNLTVTTSNTPSGTVGFRMKPKGISTATLKDVTVF